MLDSLKTKTLWDWLHLLVVPFALLIGGFYFSAAQVDRQIETENNRVIEQRRVEDNRITEQRKVESNRISEQRKIENRRVLQQQSIENQRVIEQQKHDDKRVAEQQDIESKRNSINILNNYRRSITNLIINGGLNTDTPQNGVAIAAYALTASTAPQLNGIEKGQLVIFLNKLQLLNKGNGLNLLFYVDLSGAVINKERFTSVNFTNVNFSYADFTDAIFIDTNFNRTDLTKANLTKTDFNSSDLRGAKLSYVNLDKAKATAAFFDIIKGFRTSVNYKYDNSPYVAYNPDEYQHLIKELLKVADLNNANLTKNLQTSIESERKRQTENNPINTK